MSEQWRVMGIYPDHPTEWVEVANEHGEVIAQDVLRKDAEQIVADHNAALALADERQALVGENERLRASLQTIRDRYGKVCDSFELCSHTACESSAGSWMEADAALASGAEDDATPDPQLRGSWDSIEYQRREGLR